MSAQRDKTGVGFNTTTNTLEVTDDQWELIIQVNYYTFNLFLDNNTILQLLSFLDLMASCLLMQRDPSMKGMRYREWPMFSDWLEIFGKDRATGEIAEDMSDAANFMHAQYSQRAGVEGVADNGDEAFNYVHLDDDNSPPSDQPNTRDRAENNTAFDKDTPQPSSNSSKKRKHKAESSELSMAVVLENFCRTTNEWRETMASRIGYEKDLGQLRTQVYGLLSNLSGLTIANKLDATELIGARNDRLEVFMGLTEEARALYAVRLLERERK